MLYFILVLLLLILAVTFGKLCILKNEIREITKAIDTIQPNSTNQQLRVGTQNHRILALANSINKLYDTVGEERRLHIIKMEEIRQSMANISHDLRTPLTTIIGYMKLLQSPQNSPEQNQHYLSTAYQKALMLNELVSNLFQMSRLETGAYNFQLESLDVNQILGEELASFHERLSQLEGQPSIELSPKPLYIIGDSTALTRCFANLLQNMVQHKASQIKITSAQTPEGIELSFSNYAPTLNQEDVAQIFNQFFVADRMRSGQNTGLGLAIVKEFIQGMGASITAHWENQILTFTIVFKQG